MDYLAEYKQHIKKEITLILQERKQEYAAVNDWGETTVAMLEQFATQGKMIRGSLMLFTASMFTKDTSKDALRTAAALELLHSSLLIHDDIMDNDTLRRGKESIHTQFKNILTQIETNDPTHQSISLAICVGDLGFFLAQELLAQTTHPNAQLISQTIARELSYVGIAQMQDVTPRNGLAPDMERILHLYKYKTGRYSISLPMMVGALLGSQSEEVVQRFEVFGEHAGVVFQLIDDRLGLFGDQEHIGKVQGSDIKENKKTIYRALLFSAVTLEEKERLEQIFGNTHLSAQEINDVQQLLAKYAIDKKVMELCTTYADNAHNAIKTLPIEAMAQRQLDAFIDALVSRTK